MYANMEAPVNAGSLVVRCLAEIALAPSPTFEHVYYRNVCFSDSSWYTP